MKRCLPLPLLVLLSFRGAACRNHQAKINVRPVKRFRLSTSTNRSFRLRAGDGEPPAKADALPLSTRRAAVLGCLLSLNSGIINGACLSGMLHPDNVKQATAAVTGAWTNSALGVAASDVGQFAFQSKCVLSYFTGSLTAGLVNPNPVPFEVNVPAGITLMIGSALLLLAYLSSGSTDFVYLAAVACGLQNSLTSTATANLVRSAHFSGITSDMGTFLGQVLRGNHQNLLKLKVFAMLAASFWTGGYFSYGLVKSHGKKVLLLGCILYLVLGILGLGFIGPFLEGSSKGE